MNRLRTNFVIAIIHALVMLILGVVLIAAVAAVEMDVNTELKQASNIDHWGIFILVSGILAILFAAFSIYDAFTLSTLETGKKTPFVAEMIYILGVGKETPRPEVIGKEVVEVTSLRSLESLRSIFGLGHDDSKHWTFAGRKATPLNEPAS